MNNIEFYPQSANPFNEKYGNSGALNSFYRVEQKQVEQTKAHFDQMNRFSPFKQSVRKLKKE